jgi:hypothetical protein
MFSMHCGDVPQVALVLWNGCGRDGHGGMPAIPTAVVTLLGAGILSIVLWRW